MKAKQSIFSILLVVSLVFGVSGVAAAAPRDGEKITDGFIVGEMERLDMSGVDPEHITELPQIKEASLDEDTEPSKELTKDLDEHDLSVEDMENAKDLLEYVSEDRSSTRAGEPYQIFTVSDVISSGTENIYQINVGSGQILQTELQVPQNLSLDYNLYLYELNADGTEAVMVSASEYDTDSSFMPESAAAINTSSTNTYFIKVSSFGTPSATDYYTLNVSLSDEYDGFEPNDSAFFALEFPEMVAGQYVTVPGGLNTPIDNDWFCLNVKSTSGFSSMMIENLPPSVVIESYTVSGGSLMKKTGTATSNKDTLPVKIGYNYFRIISNRDGAFTPIDNYSIKFSTALEATKTYVLIADNGYCQRFSSNFSDGETRGLYEMGSNINFIVMYLNEDDYLVKVDDRVDVEIYNPKWSNEYMQYKRNYGTITNDNICIVPLNPPAIFGTSTTKYNDVRTTVKSQKFGTILTRKTAVVSKYDNGELNKPCVHNGTCGLK